MVPTSDFDEIFGALQRASVRYLVVGGVAVVLHGVPRFTADLDLVIGFDADNVQAAITALSGLGYRPRAPVPLEQLADAEARRSWIEEKGIVVLSLWSPQHPATEIDVFVEEPFTFDEAYARATTADLETTIVPVASIEDLVEMKRRVGRAKDLADIAALEQLSRGRDGGS